MFGGLFLRDPGGDVGTGCSALGFCWTHKQAKPFLAIWRGRSPSSRRQQSATEELSNVIFNFNLNSNINIRPVDTINLKEQRHRHQPAALITSSKLFLAITAPISQRDRN